MYILLFLKCIYDFLLIEIVKTFTLNEHKSIKLKLNTVLKTLHWVSMFHGYTGE